MEENMKNQKVYNVLFLCTGNSARSILAESILNHLGKGRFHGYSAGSHPKGEVHPLAIDLLESIGMPVDGLRSKNWDEFARPGAPEMDFVFTVCDNAAGEVCPIWPGRPITAHWGVPDPVAVEGNILTRKAAFLSAYRQLEKRIALFTSLRVSELDRLALKKKVDEIGKSWNPSTQGSIALPAIAADIMVKPRCG
jgi:arsenate reductase